jgi:hypothetical protein
VTGTIGAPGQFGQVIFPGHPDERDRWVDVTLTSTFHASAMIWHQYDRLPVYPDPLTGNPITEGTKQLPLGKTTGPYLIQVWATDLMGTGSYSLKLNCLTF